MVNAALALVIGGPLAWAGGAFTHNRGTIRELQKEVATCRERDAHVIVLTACFRSLWGEQMRRDPNNPVLKMCGDLIASKLPITPEERSLDGFEDLMAALERVPGTKDKKR